ncbi:MAG: SAM-dependent methyltransferase [Bifidobacteriaceae bacterium]|jgi:predicted RNA methylase|nr:SAM-dependent methyltransferase [Bifidobacteriaceae bacterium]
MMNSQQHLSHKRQVDLGSFYTPKSIVDLTYSVLKRNVKDLENWTIFDSSCGYGSFLVGDFGKRKIGADVDESALNEAKSKTKDVQIYKANSLQNIARQNYNIATDEKLVIIGNPPYNDATSMIHQKTKDKFIQNQIDRDVKTRDLGMSFLLSYDKLHADYICVLHPLSYLIKKANFASLKMFTKNYKLIDGIVISSHEFSDTSRRTAFPILIALYKRGEKMDYDFIKKYRFKTMEGTEFCLDDFDTIANYISKYPNKNSISATNNPVAKFYTMRDINALKRSRTFIDSDMSNTVYIVMDKLPYYCYVDIFKKYADKLPYYLGNCDVIIDNREFEKIKDCFVSESVHSNPILKRYYKFHTISNATQKIEKYFTELLREHIFTP